MEPSVWHAVSVAGRVCLIALILLACLGVPAAAQSAPQNTSVSLARPGRMPAVKTSSTPVATAGDVAGTMLLEVVVDVDGLARHVRVARGLSPASDAAAVAAVGQWTFEPARSGRGQRFATVAGLELSYARPDGVFGPWKLDAKLVPLEAEPLPSTASVKSWGSRVPGLTLPRVVREVRPEYTPEAMKAKVIGDVVLEVVVLDDGSIGAARVLTSLDQTYGLDRAALIAARYWLFEPGELNGKPVPVRLVLSLSFRIF